MPRLLLLTRHSKCTENAGKKRATAVLVVLVLAGLTLAACTASDEELATSLRTSERAEVRQRAAVDLAGRHSIEATQGLVDAAADDPRAAAGVAALRDAYLAILAVPPDEELTEAAETALLETIDCLAAIGDSAAVAGLSALVLSPNPFMTRVRTHAVQALGDLGTDPAREALVAAIVVPDGSGAGEVRRAAAAFLRTRPEAAAALVAAWEGASADARRAVQPILVALGEPAARELAAALARGEGTAWIPDLLCALGAPAISATGALLEDPSGTARLDAVGVLICLRAKDAAAVDALLAAPARVPLLIEARTQAGLGETANRAIEDILVTIGEPAVAPVVAVLGATDWAPALLVRLGAIAGPALVSALGGDDPAGRQAALATLLDFYTASPGDAAPFVVTAERAPALVEAYLSQDLGPESTVGTVLVSIGEPAVAVLVGSAVDLLTDAATWTDPVRARRVYELILRFDPQASTNALVAAVAQDPARRLRILFLAVKLGIPGSEDRLNDLLIRHGDKSMAEDFLNSGSDVLGEGGERWAAMHGYTVTTGPGSSRTTWGAF